MSKNFRILMLVVIALFGGFYLYKKTSLFKKPEKSKVEKSTNKKKPAHSPSKQIGDKDKKYHEVEDIKEFFTQLGCVYTRSPIFSDDCKVFENTKREDYLDYTSSPEAKAELDMMEKKYASLIKMNYVAPIYIMWAGDKIGYGLYALEDLPEGTLISEYSGKVMYKKDVPTKIWCWRYPITGDFKKGFPENVSLDGGKYGNELRFINHSDNPNVSPKCVYNGNRWCTMYITNKFIPKDTQITVSYGQPYWRKRTKIDIES